MWVLGVERQDHRRGLDDVVFAERADGGADREELGRVGAPGVAVLAELDADDALGVEFLCLVLYTGHRQLTGVVEGLGELLELDVASDVADDRAHPLVGDVVDARPHDQAQGRVARPDQRPEVLAGQVGGERLALVVAPVVDAAAARVRLRLDRGADRDELGDVRAELLQRDVEADADDAVRAERVRLRLHPGHRQLPGVVQRLGEHGELLVLAPAADLEADVVDRGAQDQAKRAEARLTDQQELFHREVGGEDRPRLAWLQFGEPLDRVLGDARHAHSGLLVRHRVVYLLFWPMSTRAAWRRLGSRDMMASGGGVARAFWFFRRTIAVPMLTASTT